ALASQTQLINQLASALSANRQRKNVKQPSEREPQQQNAEQQHQNGRQCRFHAMEVQREREVPSPPKSCVNYHVMRLGIGNMSDLDRVHVVRLERALGEPFALVFAASGLVSIWRNLSSKAP